MQLLSFLGLAATLASVTAAQEGLPPQPNIKYDAPWQTADWYKEQGKPIPAFAPEITVIEENRSYVVKLECPSCPFFVEGNRREDRKTSWQERDNSLLLKFDLSNASSGFATMRANGARILPLDPMPLYMGAYQVAANLTQETMDSIVNDRMLDADFAWQTGYHNFPLQYEHTLLKTETPGQWWLQFDVTGLQYGEDGEPVHFNEAEHKLVQLLVKEVEPMKGARKELFIEDVQVVERSQRAQPIKMKCGKLAMVKTTFDPNEWDEYGKLGSWSRIGNMVFGKIGQYWEDHFQHNALLLPLALLLAFVIFFARVWHQRQQGKEMDAEYALLESTHDNLPPAYSDIPVIKIEEYD